MKRKRILLKLSGEALKGSSEGSLDVEFIATLIKKVMKLHAWGMEIIIVIGAGNIWRGVTGEQMGLDRTTADYMGMVATMINGMALANVIEQQWWSARVMTSLDMPRVAEPYIHKRALKHLEKGRIVICVWGTWNPFFSTDSAAVLRALELHCDVVIKWTNIDGIYDKHPELPEAKKYATVTYDEVLAKNLKVMDPSAIALAKDEWMPIYVTHIDGIESILTWSISGTLVIAKK
jgi:uridylate kinase